MIIGGKYHGNNDASPEIWAQVNNSANGWDDAPKRTFSADITQYMRSAGWYYLDFGAKVGYIENYSIWHHEVKKWSVLFKKFYRYGKGYFRALGVSPKIVTLHSMPRASYFRKSALEKPLYFSGLFLLYFVKVFAASSGALSFLLKKMFNKNI